MNKQMQKEISKEFETILRKHEIQDDQIKGMV